MDCKICIDCDETKNEDEFRWKCKVSGKRKAECKECSKKRDKKYYTPERRQKLSEAGKARMKKSKKWLNNFKEERGCAKCDEKRFYVLDLHHRDEDEKEYNISHMRGKDYSLKKIKQEVNKCEVLCANCHREHHHFEKLEKMKMKTVQKQQKQQKQTEGFVFMK